MQPSTIPAIFRVLWEDDHIKLETPYGSMETDSAVIRDVHFFRCSRGTLSGLNCTDEEGHKLSGPEYMVVPLYFNMQTNEWVNLYSGLPIFYADCVIIDLRFRTIYALVFSGHKGFKKPA